MPELSFLCHKMSKNGLKHDPDVVVSILNMNPSQNMAEVQWLTGIANDLPIFLPRLSDVMKPIRRQLRKIKNDCREKLKLML